MISHFSFGVRNIARSRAFYDSVLIPLGCSRVEVRQGELAYGPGGQQIFVLYEVSGETSLASQGTHVAFAAPDREKLCKAADAARAQGSTFTRDPGRHPDISPTYYGAVFFDPDGHKIELVAE